MPKIPLPGDTVLCALINDHGARVVRPAVVVVTDEGDDGLVLDLHVLLAGNRDSNLRSSMFVEGITLCADLEDEAELGWSLKPSDIDHEDDGDSNDGR